MNSDGQRLDYKSSEYSDMLAFLLCAATLILVLGAEFLGEMSVIVTIVALALAALVWQRPQEAPGVAMLYLFGCNVLFPSSARFDATQSTIQMYYWAVGLLVITLAAIMRLGLLRVSSVPWSARVFLVVAFAAALYGRAHGAATSYVIRQFYGALLLVAYMGISLHVGNLSLLVRRVSAFGVLCAFAFYVYFAGEFAERGFHREMTTVGSQAAMMAVILLIFGLEHRKLSWLIGSVALILVPSLIFQRRDVLTFLLALPLTLAVTVRSKGLRFLCYGIVAFLLLPGFLPPVAQWVGEVIQKAPYIGKVLPEGGADSDTLLERDIQLGAALETVQTHPVLGAGLGGDIEWLSPVDGLYDGAYVDNGWAYLLQKMGLLGVLAFLWFSITLARNFSRELLAPSICLVCVLLMTMFSEPIFFHFTTAPFAGSFAGLIFAGSTRNVDSSPPALQA